MPYVNIPKPTGTNYTKVRNGYPLYDDTSLSYDDSSGYYDGNAAMPYTNIPKPSNSSYTKILKPT